MDAEKGRIRPLADSDGEQVLPEILQDAFAEGAREIVRAGDEEACKQALCAFAGTIRHCGDYGLLFWNADEGKVVWVGGDADGDPGSGHTDFDDIRAGFLAVPGVREVEIADEWIPDEDEGYEDLGAHGVAVW